MGTLTSWNPLGHSRPVTGLPYLYIEKTDGEDKQSIRQFWNDYNNTNTTYNAMDRSMQQLGGS
jgi:hypothetical protein